MRTLPVLLASALAAVLAAPAQANFVAAVEVPNSAGNLDIAVLDASTGTRFELPAGINTSGNEFHPSVSEAGSFLVFERHTPTGAVRIIMANLDNGQQADLFSGLEASSSRPVTPSISPNGARVITGAGVKNPAGTPTRVISVDVSGFPGGPFPKSEVTSAGGVGDSTTRNPSVVNSGQVAWQTSRPPPNAFIALSYAPSGDSVFEAGTFVDHPAILPSDPGFSVFEKGDAPADLAVHQAGQTSSLLSDVNSGRDESRPAFDASGRYLGFIRHEPTGLDRLRVWDTTTQTIVTSVGIGQAGPSPGIGVLSRTSGALSLFVPSPLISRFSCCKIVKFSNLSPTTAGLLVQRIVGKRKLFGRVVPKLRKAGRFPLGQFRKGSHRKRWPFAVGVRKQRTLRRGCYLVTLRALTRKGRVRDLSKPYTVRIRNGRRPLVRRGVRLRTCSGR
jgi:hypothetical protein